MAIFHFSQFEHELFCWYFKRLNVFLAQCDYCMGKWKILGIIDECVNNETGILLQFWDFHGKMLIKLGVCLSGLHGYRLSLKRLVVFLDIHLLIHVHSMLDRTMLLCGVTCVTLMPIMLVLALIMHTVPILIRLYL